MDLQAFSLDLLLMMKTLQVKNFILLGDIHKSIYFLSWKEQGSQLNLLAKDFGSLDCLATEFLIDGSTLSLTVSDDQKNVQVSIFVDIHEALGVCVIRFCVAFHFNFFKFYDCYYYLFLLFFGGWGWFAECV